MTLAEIHEQSAAELIEVSAIKLQKADQDIAALVYASRMSQAFNLRPYAPIHKSAHAQLSLCPHHSHTS